MYKSNELHKACLGNTQSQGGLNINEFVIELKNAFSYFNIDKNIEFVLRSDLYKYCDELKSLLNKSSIVDIESPLITIPIKFSFSPNPDIFNMDIKPISTEQYLNDLGINLDLNLEIEKGNEEKSVLLNDTDSDVISELYTIFNRINEDKRLLLNNNNIKMYTDIDVTSDDNLIGSGTYSKVYEKNIDEENMILKFYINFNFNNIVYNNDIFKELVILTHLNKYTNSAVKLYGIKINEKNCFMVYEKFGKSLDIINSEKRKFSFEQYKKIFYNILNAFNQIYEVGVIHGDLKLQNILMDDDLEIKIIDFGLSVFLGFGPNLIVSNDLITTKNCYLDSDTFKTYQTESYSIAQIFIQLILSDHGYYYKNNKFHDIGDELTHEQINKYVKIKMENKYNDFIDLMNKLTDSDIIKRISAKEALKMDFFKEQHGGLIENITYTEKDFEDKNFEFKYVDDIISNVSKITIYLNEYNYDINEDNLIVLIKTLLNKEFTFETIFNTLYQLRKRNVNINNVKEKNKEFVIFETLLHIYTIQNNDFNYQYSEDMFKTNYKKMSISVTNNLLKNDIVFDYILINSMIEYIKVIFNHIIKIDFDEKKYMLLLCLCIMLNDSGNLNIGDLCMYVLNSMYKDDLIYSEYAERNNYGEYLLDNNFIYLKDYIIFY